MSANSFQKDSLVVCGKCGKAPARPGQHYCADCKNAYMREWRKTHPLTEEAKKRDSARSYANEYKKRGKLTPQPCKFCGAAETEMHHPDHELPLMVVWLCRPCHLSWHEFWRGVAATAWSFWSGKARRDSRREAA